MGISTNIGHDTGAQVAPFHMAATVNNVTNEMTFLYKFLPGRLDGSDGLEIV
jgi:DNA mismatch repair ATPase MutS